MLDLIVRTITWVLSLCTPRPRGRHRLRVLPPLRTTPALPPPRFTELLDGNASHLVRPYVLNAAECHHRRECRRAAYRATFGIHVDPEHMHGVRVPAATR